MTAQTAPASLTGRIVSGWGETRKSFRALLDSEPGEARLFFLAMLSGVFIFLGGLAEIVLGIPGSGPNDEVRGRISAELVSAVFFRTIALYAIAGLSGLVMRAFRQVRPWRDVRAAFFWAALLAAPLILAASLLALMVSGVSLDVARAISAIGPILFAWFWACCLAELYGFRHNLSVFLVIVGVAAALLSAVFLLTRV